MSRSGSFAFADPLGVGLKDGKHFFAMRNRFALQDPAPNLVDLPFGMRQITVKIRQHRCRYTMLLVQALPGRGCPVRVNFGLVEVGLIGGFDLCLLGLPLGFVL